MSPRAQIVYRNLNCMLASTHQHSWVISLRIWWSHIWCSILTHPGMDHWLKGKHWWLGEAREVPRPKGVAAVVILSVWMHKIWGWGHWMIFVKIFEWWWIKRIGIGSRLGLEESSGSKSLEAGGSFDVMGYWSWSLVDPLSSMWLSLVDPLKWLSLVDPSRKWSLI